VCARTGIKEFQKWAETGKKHCQILVENLANACYEVLGKSTFKEEFVTAGGIALEEIDLQSFSSLRYPSLYFGGEVLNIDAITGGFNFQAAWTAGWIVAQEM
jgi:predicted flavoprotein YhiN